MKRVNFPLLIGSVILMVLLALSYFPEFFTDRDPIHEEPPRYIEYEKEGEIVEELSVNPMRPNTINLMGTDDAGRDIFARLVYGTRNTMQLGFFIALFRMIIALPIGIFAGMGRKTLSRIIGFFNTFFSAVPMLIFSYIVLNFNYFYRMQMEKSIVAFAIVLALVGWSKLAGIIEDVTKRIMAEDFIEGELAIGKTKTQIIFQNVLPHLIPHGVSQFFKEMAMGLFLVAQLAVLYVFVGTTREVGAMAFRANYRMGLEPEWGGMLSRITNDVMRFEEVWWVSLFPVLFFAVAIMGINLLGEGLRLEFQKRTSRVISTIRKGISSLSPKLLYLQIRDIRKYYKPVLLKAGVFAFILLYLFMPRYQSIVDYDIDGALNHLDALSDVKYKGRASGTEGGYQAGEYILSELNSLGYQTEVTEIPFYDGEPSPESLKVMAPMTVQQGTITLSFENGTRKTYRLHEDFTLFTIAREELLGAAEGEFYYAGTATTEENLGKVSSEKSVFPITEHYIRELLSSTGSPFSVEKMRGKNTFGEAEKREFMVQFMLLDDYSSVSNAYLHKTTTIIPFDEMREDLYEGFAEAEITFSYPELPRHSGRIIQGFLPGSGFSKEKPGETIVIGGSYDGVYETGDISPQSAAPASALLTLAKQTAELENPLSKSVSFVFWDNQYEIKKNTNEEGSEYFHRELLKTIDLVVSGGYYYYELNYPGMEDTDTLNIVSFPAQGGRKPSYKIGRRMEDLMTDMKIPYRRFQSIFYDTSTSSSLGVYDMVTRSVLDMRLNGFFSVGIGLSQPKGMGTVMDQREKLNVLLLNRIGQVMLDNLTMNEELMENGESSELKLEVAK